MTNLTKSQGKQNKPTNKKIDHNKKCIESCSCFYGGHMDHCMGQCPCHPYGCNAKKESKYQKAYQSGYEAGQSNAFQYALGKLNSLKGGILWF